MVVTCTCTHPPFQNFLNFPVVIQFSYRFTDSKVCVIFNSSYDITVIQWIMSCHKNGMTTCVITLWCIRIMSLTLSVSTVHFLVERKFSLAVIKPFFEELCNKQNLTFMVISYETRRRLIS